MITEAKPWPRKDLKHERYRECPMCSAWYERYELSFDAGSAEPTDGETVTGAGGCTGVVTDYTLESGTWAGGDAAGVVELSGVTGATDGLAFVDDEALTGSSTFVGTANGVALQKKYGERRPTGECSFRDGYWWCNTHYNFRFNKQDVDTAPLRVEEVKYQD